MNENPKQSVKVAEINSAGSMAGLLGLFVIACVEFQRLWPTGTSLIYLSISLPLLGIWIAHQAGWKQAEDKAGLAVDISIYILVVASLGIRFGASQTTSELASTLLFWAPLVSAWWAWRYQRLPFRLWILLGGFFVVLTWLLASDHERLDEHLILSLLIAVVVRTAYRSAPPNPETAVNLRDPLTGLPSPECFEAELAHVSAISDRYHIPLTLIGCEVTLPETNLDGDEQLCQYAETIVNRLRTADTPCHWKRGTFMMLLPNTPEIMAIKVASGISEAFEHFNFEQKMPLTVTIATVQHETGEDPMSTLCALENKLAKSPE